MAKPKKKGSGNATGATVAVFIGLALASGGMKVHKGIHADLTAIGGAGQYTPTSWARAVLRADGLPRTPCDVGALTAWEAAEGGHWHNTAQYNPLDTTQPEPGSQSMNSAGVQAYPSWQEGLQATLATLNNGRYSAIISALQAGDNAQQVADTVSASSWGTGGFQANC